MCHHLLKYSEEKTEGGKKNKPPTLGTLSTTEGRFTGTLSSLRNSKKHPISVLLFTLLHFQSRFFLRLRLLSNVEKRSEKLHCYKHTLKDTFLMSVLIVISAAIFSLRKASIPRSLSHFDVVFERNNNTQLHGCVLGFVRQPIM